MHTLNAEIEKFVMMAMCTMRLIMLNY